MTLFTVEQGDDLERRYLIKIRDSVCYTAGQN
jgi:hypothetical protein